MASPPEAAALIAKYRAGGSREQLETIVREAFPRDAATRVAAMKWIDEVRPGSMLDEPTPAPAQRGGRIQRVVP